MHLKSISVLPSPNALIRAVDDPVCRLTDWENVRCHADEASARLDVIERLSLQHLFLKVQEHVYGGGE